MQMIGWIGVFFAGAAAVAGFSVSLYIALPKAMLAYAERHGRFQGLSAGERVADGTRTGEPPVVRPVRAAQGAMAQGLAS
jgi:hypothetical protein